ncbi:MAG: hypothetical protein GY828_02120 [Candidatus Gracilibacteria bacterium]|nr:hypothetical protein [Candidatus Gracilibacteria bacterium]
MTHSITQWYNSNTVKIYGPDNLPEKFNITTFKHTLINGNHEKEIEDYVSWCGNKYGISQDTLKERIGKSISKTTESLGLFTSHKNEKLDIFFQKEIKDAFLKFNKENKLTAELKIRAKNKFGIILPSLEEIENVQKGVKKSVKNIKMEESKNIYNLLRKEALHVNCQGDFQVLTYDYSHREKKMKFLHKIFIHNRDFFDTDVISVRKTLGISKTLYKFLIDYVEGTIEKQLKKTLEELNISFEEIINLHIQNPYLIIENQRILFGVKSNSYSIDVTIYNEILSK